SSTTRSEEEELLARSEDFPVIGTFRIDPEFKHPARRVDRTRDTPVADELANITDVNEHDAAIVLKFNRVLCAICLDRVSGLGQPLRDGQLERHLEHLRARVRALHLLPGTEIHCERFAPLIRRATTSRRAASIPTRDARRRGRQLWPSPSSA